MQAPKSAITLRAVISVALPTPSSQHSDCCSNPGTAYCLQDRREWIEKDALMSLEPPGGAGGANGKGRGAGFRRPTSGDDYYELLQVRCPTAVPRGGAPCPAAIRAPRQQCVQRCCCQQCARCRAVQQLSGPC